MVDVSLGFSTAYLKRWHKVSLGIEQSLNSGVQFSQNCLGVVVVVESLKTSVSLDSLGLGQCLSLSFEVLCPMG